MTNSSCRHEIPDCWLCGSCGPDSKTKSFWKAQDPPFRHCKINRFWDLPDVISVNPSLGAWAPATAVPRSAHTCFFLRVIGLPPYTIEVGFPLFPVKTISRRISFSGLQPFLYVQAPKFARLPVASGFLCEGPESGSCSAVAESPTGNRYEISGAGTFDAQKKSAQAAGTFTHKSINGM